MAQAFHSDDLGKLVLRITVAGLLLFHGIYKAAHGIDWIVPMLSELSIPSFVRFGVFIAEIVAPLFILAGFWTRLAGLVVAFNLGMAILLAFRDKIFTLKEMGGGWIIELEIFFLLSGVALFFLGAGKYSVTKGKGTWN